MSTKKRGGNTNNHHTRKNILFRKTNCHPGIKKNKILDHSCFTKDSIKLLKETFNKHHPEKKIITNDPKQIWKNLHEKIPECDRETCWLQQIPNKYLQDKLKKDLFSPSQPTEWKNKPNTWLSNFDIDAVIQQYEEANPDFLFLGPTPIDFDTVKNGKCIWSELCKLNIVKEYKRGKRRFGVIFNLDTSDGPGTHWVSLFMDIKDPTPFLFYFNSTGEGMPEEVKDLIERLEKQFNLIKPLKNRKLRIIENTKMQHQESNTECGMYSLFFIITCLTRNTEPSEDVKKLSTDDLIALFAGNTRIPDKYIEKYRGIYFNA
jgi:hypothetical protein